MPETPQPEIPLGDARSAHPVLVCPACLSAYGGIARIGNRKSTCKSCNRFAQAVKRAVARRLIEQHPYEAAAFIQRAEVAVHAQMFDKPTRSTPIGTTDSEAAR